LILAVVTAAAPARARDAADPRLTEGARFTPVAAAEVEDARALERHPAGLAFQEGLDFRYSRAGREDGLEVDGAVVSANLAGLLTPAFGVSFVRLGDDATGASQPDFVKIGYGLGLRLGETFGLGFAGAAYTSRQSEDWDGLSTFDAGLAWRPWRMLALSATARHLNAPRLGALDLVRRYDLGVALRPLGDLVTLGADVRIAERRTPGLRLVDPVYTARVSPVDGITLAASLDHDLAAFATLSVDLEHVGVGGGAAFADGDGWDGYVAELRGSTAAWPPLTRVTGRLLEITLEGDLPYLGAPGLFSDEDGYIDRLLQLRAAARDPDVGGVLVTISDLACGWARAAELRRVLAGIVAAGKPAYAYLPGGGDKDYYVASAASRVVGHPSASLFVNGLEHRGLFFAGLLARAGVEAQFVKIGDYKTAPNTFTEQEATQAQREQDQRLIDGLQTHVQQAILRSRNIDAERLQVFTARGVSAMTAARDAGLVDEVAHYADLRQRLAQEHGIDEGYFARSERDARWGVRPRIGVVLVDGAIHGGESDGPLPFSGPTAGAMTIARALEELVRDADVRAIVVRIDSPGGTVVAADDIWRAVGLAAQRKPLVVSLGDVAASGGYYAAVGAERILAEPTSITGSIGIFSGKFSFAHLMDTLGVNQDTARTAPAADLMSWHRPWSDAERAAVQQVIEAGYARFVDAVAAGRGLTAEAVDAVGRGRVWTGEQALEHKLVDGFGGLADAITAARERAGLAPWAEIELAVRPRPGLLTRLTSSFAPRLPVRVAGLLAEAAQLFAPFLTPAGAAMGRGEPMALMPRTVVVD
jgi:protease-4